MSVAFSLSCSQSTPESWAQYSHDNIARAEHERMASIQLRTLIDNVLEDTSRDMREQCDTVDVNFQKRVTEMEDAKAKLEENLKKVSMLEWRGRKLQVKDSHLSFAVKDGTASTNMSSSIPVRWFL